MFLVKTRKEVDSRHESRIFRSTSAHRNCSCLRDDISLSIFFPPHSPVLHSRRVKRAIILVNSEQLAVIKHRKPSQLGTQLFLNKIPPDCFVGLGTTVIINPGERSLGRLHTGRGCARLGPLRICVVRVN